MENIFKYRTLNIIIFIFLFYHVKQDTAGVKHNHSRWRKEAIEFSRHVMMSFSFQKAVAFTKQTFLFLNLDKTSRRNIGDKILDIGLGDNALNFTLKIKSRKKGNNWHYIKPKSSAHTHTHTHTQTNKLKSLLNGRKYFQIIHLSTGFFRGFVPGPVEDIQTADDQERY